MQCLVITLSAATLLYLACFPKLKSSFIVCLACVCVWFIVLFKQSLFQTAVFCRSCETLRCSMCGTTPSGCTFVCPANTRTMTSCNPGDYSCFQIMVFDKAFPDPKFEISFREGRRFARGRNSCTRGGLRL